MQIRRLASLVTTFWLGTYAAGLCFAQQNQQAGGNIGTSAGGAGGSRGTRPSTGEPFPGQTFPGQSTDRPIFLSGKVVLDDGSTPLEPIKIERVCGNANRLEAYTDRKGNFSFEIGRNQEIQDASQNPFDTLSGPGIGASRSMGGMNGRAQADRSLFGCDIRAALPGFRSDSVPLANMHYMDNPDIGTIVLHRLAKVDGLTVSATIALAPKDAKKAFEKGEQALRKGNPDEAQKNFQKAVDLYPRHAAAWFELGMIQERREHVEDALKAYQQSIGADSKFIPPHQRLAAIALVQSKWPELEEHSSQVIKLNPVDYPDAYYMNAVAQLELHNFDAAEKQVREAIRLDSSQKMMRAYYVLGLAQAQQQNFSEAAQSLRTFLAGAGDVPDAANVRDQLAQIEHLAEQKTASGAQ